ncbi:beta-lactamase family protein [Archangium violaceum]|uniref:serine hydrolase domain-containing protein n=1 Tax=Archangium violaceum TaxID=83451 RepID=UPI00193BE228|nr:serine hydrolase domain-containing protein [Archangium violaceum]QRK04685.1 beta-lactamase family protein [Archangium violaceum]
MNRKHPFSRRQALYFCTALLGLGVFGSACDDRGTPPEQPRADYSRLKAELGLLIKTAMTEADVAGLSIALVDGQEVVWSRGFGFANVAERTPATPETVYEAGSLAKVFTGAAIMQLAEQERIALDRPIEQFIPGFSIQSRFSNAGPVTPRNLLTHHAGIPEQQLVGAYAQTPLTLAERVEHLREDHLANPPDKLWAYSNGGFAVLGRAIETVSGMEFTAYMNQYILGPLGMTHSSFRLDSQVASKMAMGYGALPVSDYPVNLLESYSPAGGLRSSVEDMSRFIRMLLAEGRFDGESVLKPASLQEMWRQQNVGRPLDMDNRIGLPWYLYELPLKNGQSVRMVEHDGATQYFRSYLSLLPEHGLGVVVLSNSENADGLVGVIAHEVLARALEIKSGLEVAPIPEEPQVQPVYRSQEELRALEGIYATQVGPMVVGLENGVLNVTVQGMRLELQPHEQGYFKGVVGDSNMWLSFEEIEGHLVMAGYFGLFGRQLQGERITPAPVPESWHGRFGRYVLPQGAPREVIEQAELGMEGDLLVLRLFSPMFESGQAVSLLNPEGDDLAVVLGLGRGLGEVVRFEQVDGTTHLIVRGIRLRMQSEGPMATSAFAGSEAARSRLSRAWGPRWGF